MLSLTDDLAAASLSPADVIAATIVTEAMLQRKASKSRVSGISSACSKRIHRWVAAVK
jgi:hypothetical protein